MHISMAASVACVFGAAISAVVGSRQVASPAPGKSRQSVIKTDKYQHQQRRESAVEKTSSPSGGLNLKDYFQQSLELVSASDGGPPRWFSPLECGSRTRDSPLLLYLPGVIGVGLGLILQHERLCKNLIIDSPVKEIAFLKVNDVLINSSGFSIYGAYTFPSEIEHHLQVQNTVRSEYSCKPNRPIYLVGESFGGCLALAVAALNTDIDLKLILANPATSFGKSQLQLQTLFPMSIMFPQRLHSSFPDVLNLLSGATSNMVAATMRKQLSLEQVIGEISQDTSTFLSPYLSVLSDVLTVETLVWKLSMVKSAAAFANSRLHAVKAEALVLISGQDQLLPSREEGERLSLLLPKCDIRIFNDCGHSLFLEDGINLVSILIGASFYRRGKCLDYVSDYLPPSPSEFQKVYEPLRWIEVATNPVMLSTMESGKIVRNLAGIPSEGPVLYVGYHMMLGLELIPLVSRIWMERNILLRGIAHPLMFTKLKEGNLPDLSAFDTFRVMGAVPVSGPNFYKLFSSKSHVLLYPGGMREALHRKGEEYKLFWPEQSEFVRMAARFGAKIIPFGSVGEDDIGQLLLDYDDLRRIPYLKAAMEDLTNETLKLRSDAGGEVSNQEIHLPIILPKVPGRFYYFFGKPIETEGRRQELKSKEKCDMLYLEVKREVEKCLGYLKEKRKDDPYRNILARLAYQGVHGFDSEIPTFPL